MRRVGFYIVCLLLTACAADPGPQRPANREGETQRDSDLMAMLQVNQRMAAEADREVMIYIQADTVHRYAQCNHGAWVTHITKVPDSEQPKMGETVQIQMQIKTLSGQLLQDVAGEYTLGKGELPLGIEYAIRELNRGEEGVIIAPWHAAFGMDGEDNIGPYTNVRIEITIQ